MEASMITKARAKQVISVLAVAVALLSVLFGLFQGTAANAGGVAVSVSEREIAPAMGRATAMEGVAICPETAACVVAAEQLVRDGWLRGDERVVLFNTASGIKYQDGTPPELPLLAADAVIDYGELC